MKLALKKIQRKDNKNVVTFSGAIKSFLKGKAELLI